MTLLTIDDAEKFWHAPERLILVASALNLFLTPLIFTLFGGGCGTVMWIRNLCVSAAIVLMKPDAYDDWKLPESFAVITLLLSQMVAMSAVSSAVFLRYAPLAYFSVATIPFAVCITIQAARMRRDTGFLSMKMSGRELMPFLEKYCLVSFFMLVCVMAALCDSYASEEASWHRTLLLGMSALFYVMAYVRVVIAAPAGTVSPEEIVENSPESTFMPDESQCQDYKEMYDKLRTHFEESKPFLNPLYSMDELVRSLASNKTYVSRLINVSTGMNFSQLVNKYRVNYARDQYALDMELKVKDLADMSGFHSQVTFIAAFKLFYGMTPGMWCKEYKDIVMKRRCLSSQKGQEP